MLQLGLYVDDVLIRICVSPLSVICLVRTNSSHVSRSGVQQKWLSCSRIQQIDSQLDFVFIASQTTTFALCHCSGRSLMSNNRDDANRTNECSSDDTIHVTICCCCCKFLFCQTKNFILVCVFVSIKSSDDTLLGKLGKMADQPLIGSN